GLPSIAIVEDPIAGKAVQIGSDLFKRVPAAVVYGRLVLLASVALLTLSSILFAFVWVPRRLARKIPGNASISVRLWPLLTSVALLSLPAAVLLMGNQPDDFALSFSSLLVFILTIVYPLLALFSLFNFFRHWKTVPHNSAFWHSTLAVLIHA